jgi:hypothetical protein
MKYLVTAILTLVVCSSLAFAGGFVGQVKVKETGDPAGYAMVYVITSDEYQECISPYSSHGCSAQGYFNTGPDMEPGYYWLHAVWYDEKSNKYEYWWWGRYESGWPNIGILWVQQDYPCPC